MSHVEKPQRVLVGIATTGRRKILSQTLRHLASLRDKPDQVFVATAEPDDFDEVEAAPLDLAVTELPGPRGSCHQRNTILNATGPDDIVFFLDDDFLPAEGYVAALRDIFEANPEIMMITGRVLADGIGGPGLQHAEGLEILSRTYCDPAAADPVDVYNGYGCNMAVRMAPVQRHGLRFDETLPAYGWLEDVDFSRRLAEHGRIVRSDRLVGVHLGTKTGRSRGRALGYSQIANPLYLVKKGTMSRRRAYYMISRNLAANLGRSFRPEPWIDRPGRVYGNLRAALDLLAGKLAPGRSTEI